MNNISINRIKNNKKNIKFDDVLFDYFFEYNDELYIKIYMDSCCFNCYNINTLDRKFLPLDAKVTLCERINIEYIVNSI